MTSATELPATHAIVRRPIPHEHGAWGLVFQPFVAAVLLAKRWDWLLLPMFFLVLFGFLLRESLTILARQRWARRSRSPESGMAMRWLAVESGGLLISIALMIQRVRWQPLSVLIAAGFVLTLVSVWFSVKNRQRSVGLQLAAVPGLALSAFAAALASTGKAPAWVWLLWVVLAFHGLISVLSVHARLEMRIASARPGRGEDPRRAAFYATLFQFAAAIPVAIYKGPALALPLVLSTAIHAIELVRLSNAGNIRERLQRVGFRTLSLSLAHTALTLIVLWPLAGV